MKSSLFFPRLKTTATNSRFKVAYKHIRGILCLGLCMFFAFFSNAQTTVTLGTSCPTCPNATLIGNAVTPVPVPTPSCGTVAGTYKVGTALTAANTITVSLNVITAGAYSITTTATNGMTFTGSGTFAATGTQTAVLTGSGTPLTSGTTGILVQYGGTSCAVSITVASNAPTALAPPVGAVNSGSLSGKTCFDVAISNDNTNGCALLTSRTPQKADFTLAATNTQIYTFTPRGTVSNVRFAYVNTNGNVITALVGGNTGNNITTPVTATASFNTGLNAPATGLTNANALTADIYVIFNDGATNNGTDRQLKITPKVKDCVCCGAWSFPDADAAQPKVWLEFLCYNLGADERADPFTYDSDILGDYYEWGRPKDGHEKWGSDIFTVGQATTLFPNHNKFIIATPWTTSTDLQSSWGDGFVEAGFNSSTNSTTPYNQKKGPNDPCPAGWKIPSNKQWQSLTTGIIHLNTVGGILAIPTTQLSANAITKNPLTPDPNFGLQGLNIGDLLFLPLAGEKSSAGLQSAGYNGIYQSSTCFSGGGVWATELIVLTNGNSPRIGFRSTGSGSEISRGKSVRCVIDK